MSSDSLPISPERFRLALKDLSIPSLHLKVLELRNSLAHLDYSNEQLSSYAYAADPANPDKDCLDAIQENEAVIQRMQERIRLVREEVEGRGFSWTEFQSKEELEALDRDEPGVAVTGDGAATTTTTTTVVNGGTSRGSAQEREQVVEAEGGGGGQVNGQSQRSHLAWADGTFQTGRIGSDGELRVDIGVGGRQGQQQQQQQQQGGGSLSDEELRRRMEERMRELGVGGGTGDDQQEDGGLHL